MRKGKIDLLAVVGGRKTTDEEMLKSAREVVYDEKIAYIESVKHSKNNLFSPYSNHNFCCPLLNRFFFLFFVIQNTPIILGSISC